MTPAHVARLRSIVGRRLGLSLDGSRDVELGEALALRVAERRRMDTDSYLDALDIDAGEDEIRALGQLLTVGETYFFRAREQFDVLREVILPGRPRSRGNELNILSAGCSSGEEPYSLAILMREYEQELRPATWLRWQVRALDVSSRALVRARAGLYSAWSLRETSPRLRERWFASRAGMHEVRAEVRSQVQFEQANLLDERTLADSHGRFDVVFCRNVLMYFTPEAARAVVAKLTSALVPGGILFVGHAESLRGLSDAYALESSHGAFYHRLARSGASARTVEAKLPAPPPRPAPIPVISARTISEAGTTNLDAVRELVAAERFEQALVALERLVPAEQDRTDVEVLRAVAHLGSGELRAAESTCSRLLESGEARVEAHVVLGLAAEHRGDASSALEHHRAAAYLEPSCAIPHLHLGRIQRRAGRLDEALVELARALELFDHEPPARVALFGGGFGRAGLLALCRSELATIGRARS